MLSLCRGMKEPYNRKEGQYLAFIHYYTKIHGQPLSQAEMQRYFKVTPPVVHNMVLWLRRKGLIERVPGVAQAIRVLLPREESPDLE